MSEFASKLIETEREIDMDWFAIDPKGFFIIILLKQSVSEFYT